MVVTHSLYVKGFRSLIITFIQCLAGTGTGMTDASFAHASLVGCGEVRTASIEAHGLNIRFGQKRDISQRFRQTFSPAQPHSLMRFVPHHILPGLFGLKNVDTDQLNVFNIATISFWIQIH